MRKVSGQKDPVMALARDLQKQAGRADHNAFLIEGAEIIRRAFEFGAPVQHLILAESFAASDEGVGLAEQAEAATVETVTASEGLIGKCLGARPIPSCAAILERRTVSLKDIFSAPCSLIQVVENGENIDNLGMLLRSAEAAGVDGVVLAEATVDPFNRRTARGSRGAVFALDICPGVEIAAFLKYAEENGVQVVATSAQSDTPYDAIDYNIPTAIIVGNEHRGITDEARAGASRVVRIPMNGRINSLNIAVAASIMLYEAVRQRS